MIYDITRTIGTMTRVWPGDTPFSAKHIMRIEDGSSVNLTTMTLSAHTGTHVDAYYHYQAAGAYLAAMPLEPYIGPARVVTVSKGDGPLRPADFDHVELAGTKRLLIHSPVSDLEDNEWPEQFPYLSVELIEWLAQLGVIMIGLDSPSVDAFTSQDLPCHHALGKAKIVNIETLYLRDVPDGEYELITLPLKIDGVCGAPVRAILRIIDQ
jgi:arylformamidase